MNRIYCRVVLGVLVWGSLATAQDLNSIIANGVRPPQVDSPAEAAIKAQTAAQLMLQNKQLMIENEQKQMELEKRRQTINERAQASRPVVAPSAGPFDIATMTTAGLMNGRAWNWFSPDFRLAYFIGVREATLLISAADAPKRLPLVLSVQEAVEALTRLFAVPENLLIPIPEAIRLVALSAEGTLPKEIEDQTAVARGASAASFYGTSDSTAAADTHP